MQRHPDHHDEVDARFDVLLRTAMAEYRSAQEQLGALLAQYSKWHCDHSTCVLKFFDKQGICESYDYTPIATFLPTKMNWCWAWYNDVFPELARSRSSRIKELTQKTKYKIFESPHFDISMNEIDELCALALYELKGKVVFKVKDQEPWLFFVLH